jgi:hypothetical protein
MILKNLAFWGIVLGLIFFPSAALADSLISYSISGVYSPNSSTTGLTGPSDSFQMTFSLPSNPVTTDFVTGDDFYVDDPVQLKYSASNGSSFAELGFLAFYELNSSSQHGGLFVDFCSGGIACVSGPEYQWTVPGPQLYTGTEAFPTLFPTQFNFENGVFAVYACPTCADLTGIGTFNGSVSAVATPEPSAVVFMLASIFCYFVFAIWQKRVRPLHNS